MNDPHVVALHYAVVIGADSDFEKAPPLQHTELAFQVEVTSAGATFATRQHFASVEDARAVVQPFVDAWNTLSDVEKGTGVFRLEYRNAEVIDRSPQPGMAHVQGIAIGTSAAIGVAARVSYASFPKPPVGFATSSEVAAMHWQYRGYKRGQIPLTSMAYFVLTILEDGRGRPGAARRWNVHPLVLSKIGDLTANKGGAFARKARGLHAELSAAEQSWLEQAIRVLIRRAGEIAADPTATRPQITMADLPPL